MVPKNVNTAKPNTKTDGKADLLINYFWPYGYLRWVFRLLIPRH
jgi:hypothetical protein